MGFLMSKEAQFLNYIDQRIDAFYSAIKELENDKDGNYNGKYVVIDKALARVIDNEKGQFKLVNAVETDNPLLFNEKAAKRIVNKINSDQYFEFKVKSVALNVYFVNMLAFLHEMKTNSDSNVPGITK